MDPLTSSSVKTGRKDATTLHVHFGSQGRHKRELQQSQQLPAGKAQAQRCRVVLRLGLSPVR